jgi:hypothetical protein
MSGVEVIAEVGSIEVCGLLSSSDSLAMLAAMPRSFVAGEQVREAGVGLLSGPGRREAAYGRSGTGHDAQLMEIACN